MSNSSTSSLSLTHSLWFLRSKDEAFENREAQYAQRGESMPDRLYEMWDDAREYWTPISFQGVFVQGEEAVVSAIAGEPPSGIASRGATYAKLSELVGDIRALD